uniref:Uncharacterized protein n=1 Tax=Oryza glumipatula TaxID=40148 RepID=A0A0D9YAD0_9ORYZ
MAPIFLRAGTYSEALWHAYASKVTRPTCTEAAPTATNGLHPLIDIVMEDREAKQFRHKPLAHEDELTILFGSMDDVEDGTMLCVGGIGDRTPCGGSEDNCTPIPTGHVGLSEDNAGRSSAQRAGKEQVVDSPPPKKTKNMEYYVERISESMLERSRNESSVIRGEQEEVAELLLQVEQDGVAQGSELYYIATDLFRSPARRAAFSSPLRKRWSKPSKEIKTRMSSSETSSSTSSSRTHFRDEWSTWWDMGATVGVLAALASSSSGGCDVQDAPSQGQEE